jgi:hypothetical protein
MHRGKLAFGLTLLFCALILQTGYARAQESRPEVPEVETPPEAQERTPIAAEKKPNVVFILSDNVGYGDLGCYGGGELRGALAGF